MTHATARAARRLLDSLDVQSHATMTQRESPAVTVVAVSRPETASTFDLSVAIHATGRADASKAEVAAWREALERGPNGARIAALTELARVGGVEAEELIRGAARLDDPHVREAARRALDAALGVNRPQQARQIGPHGEAGEPTAMSSEPFTAWLVLRYDGGARVATTRLDQRGRGVFRLLPRDAEPYRLAFADSLGCVDEPLAFARRPTSLAASTDTATQFDEPEYFEIASHDGALICTLSRHDATTLDVCVESRLGADHEGACVRVDLHGRSGDISHSRLLILHESHGAVEGRCQAPLPEMPPRLTFHTIEFDAPELTDSDLTITSYQAADTSGRRAWRRALAGRPKSSQASGLDALRDHVTRSR